MTPIGHVSLPCAPREAVPPLIAALLYAKRASTLAARGRPLPVWRQICFGSGLVVIGLATLSPLGDRLADELVLAHMIEHLLIGDIAALLLVLGLTGPLLQPLLGLPGLRHLQVLVNPLVAFPIWAIDLYVWHIPALYDKAYGGAALHALEHTMFIASG